MGRSLLDKLRRFIGHERFVLVALALGLLLTAPSVLTGLSADDHIHRLWVQKGGLCTDLFTFASGDPEVMRWQKSAGALPFWADDEMKISFFRPLASLSHCLDYRWFDGLPVLFHLENLAWFALAITTGFAFYRRTLGLPFAAGLATLFFAVDEGNGKVAGWIANRNLLMATSFGLLTLVLHDRARREGSRKSAFGAVLAFGIALLSGEAAIATLAYLVSYALFLDEGSWKARLRSLLPHALLLVPWQLAYRYLGHGQKGSAFYTNPLSDPLTFASNVVERAPILLLSLLGGPQTDPYPLAGQDERQRWWLLAVGVLVVAALFVAPLVRRSRQARFFAAGLVLAVLPACGTFPNDRVLMLASVGGMGLLASFVASAFADGLRLPRLLAQPLAGGLVLVHGIVAPVLQPLRSIDAARIEGDIGEVSRSLFHEAKPGDAVIALNAGENMFTCTFANVLARELGYGQGVQAQCLSATAGPVSVVRIDPRRLVVRAEEGFFDPLKEPFWNAAEPMRKGHQLDLGWLRVTLLEVTERGTPLEALFHFHYDLDDPAVHLRFLDPARTAYVDAPVPPVGGKLVVADGKVVALETPRARRGAR